MNNIPVLILVDVQNGFLDSYWGNRNNLDAEKVISSLLTYWRKQDWPVFHIQHLSQEKDSPLRPESEGSAFMEFARPHSDEKIFQKHVNSAFIGTTLETELREKGLKNLLFCGFTTDHCVSTSIRMAKNLGFCPSIISDATVAFDRFDHKGNHYGADLVHAVSIASLRNEFARILESKMILSNDMAERAGTA